MKIQSQFIVARNIKYQSNTKKAISYHSELTSSLISSEHIEVAFKAFCANQPFITFSFGLFPSPQMRIESLVFSSFSSSLFLSLSRKAMCRLQIDRGRMYPMDL